MKPSLPINITSIEMSIKTQLKFDPAKSILEQLGHAQRDMMHETSRHIYRNLMIKLKETIAQEYPNLGFYDEKERKILTPLGDIEIPDWEIRDKKTKKYIARTTGFIGGIDKKKRHLEASRKIIQEVLPKLSFRKSSQLLNIFWGKFSHQRLHKIFQDLPECGTIEIIKKGLPWSDVKRILLYLDGFCIKTRIKKGAELIRDTFRFGCTYTKTGSQLIIKWFWGLLDTSYEKIIDQLISEKDKLDTVVLADGEKSIEQAVQSKGLEFQSCLFHFSKNLLVKFFQDGCRKMMAEEYILTIKNLIFISQKRALKFKDQWEKVIMNRLDGIYELITEIRKKQFYKTADSIERACPFLFTYIKKLCAGANENQRWWIGRTSNPIERPFRCLAYRMKRIGAVWNPYSAMKMISLCLQNYYHTYPPNVIKPLFYTISIEFVKC